MLNSFSSLPSSRQDWQTLVDYLALIRTEPIADTKRLVSLLEPCWDQFNGTDAESMSSYKLYGRAESVSWKSPFLRFTIERHGGTAMGSSRAELHEWTLDFNAKTASCVNAGYRQLCPMRKRLDVPPLAESVAKPIINGEQDERLKWNADGSVDVKIGKILPKDSAKAQTLAGRRKRFREVLDKLLTGKGWQVIRPNRYRPTGPRDKTKHSS